MFKTIEWTDDGVVMIDQRALPLKEEYLTLKTPEDVADAIKRMVIRGAPAIGVAAAMGIALGARMYDALPAEDFRKKVEQLFPLFASTRPTAVNLFWAIERMRKLFHENASKKPVQMTDIMIREAKGIMEEDIQACRKMGAYGAALIPQKANVLTHCNAGALATAGYGTALGVIRAAVEQGKSVRVFADETRPFLQGARLTAWELMKDNIETILITDNMAGYLMKKGEIDIVITGADRIASNGDAANKIGTYTLSILARAHTIPFYIAAPLSSIDMTIASGELIPIEERDHEEVTCCGSTRIAPEGILVRNPAFDVTPNENISAIITERGIAKPPYTASLRAMTS